MKILAIILSMLSAIIVVSYFILFSAVEIDVKISSRREIKRFFSEAKFNNPNQNV